MKRIIFFLLTISLFVYAIRVDTFPQVEITNGLIKARLYLPEPEKGY